VAGDLVFKDPLKHQPLAIRVVPVRNLSVIGHQRKARPAHLKALTASMQRMGFVTPLTVVERQGAYVVIDGQHRFQVGVDLGMKEFPVVVVPEELTRKMMSLNVEQALNIRERCTIALSIYCEVLEESPDRAEDDAELVDAIESAHLVTLGLAYERSGRLAGSAFEPILKKCDGFLDTALEVAHEARQARAGQVLDAAKLVKAVEDALKADGSWHSMARYQIISYANPTKRARKVADFDKTFAKFLATLEGLVQSPHGVLRERVE
jgi:ParB family chromosome partitioning protein